MNVQSIDYPLRLSAFHTVRKSALHAKGCEAPCQTVPNHSTSMSVGLKWSRNGGCVSNQSDKYLKVSLALSCNFTDTLRCVNVYHALCTELPGGEC